MLDLEEEWSNKDERNLKACCSQATKVELKLKPDEEGASTIQVLEHSLRTCNSMSPCKRAWVQQSNDGASGSCSTRRNP